MRSTRTILTDMAAAIDLAGLHRGEQFAHRGPGNITRLDICAHAYMAANWLHPDRIPTAFFTDEAASFDLIEGCEPAMAAIRAISADLDTDVCETNGQPDYIEHVSTWAMTPPVGCTQPPATGEVIGRILRTAQHLGKHAA